MEAKGTYGTLTELLQIKRGTLDRYIRRYKRVTFISFITTIIMVFSVVLLLAKFYAPFGIAALVFFIIHLILDYWADALESIITDLQEEIRFVARMHVDILVHEYNEFGNLHTAYLDAENKLEGFLLPFKIEGTSVNLDDLAEGEVVFAQGYSGSRVGVYRFNKDEVEANQASLDFFRGRYSALKFLEGSLDFDDINEKFKNEENQHKLRDIIDGIAEGI